MSNLITAEKYFDPDETLLAQGVPPSLLANTLFPAADPRPPAEGLSNITVEAFVNHGRWMVRCPFCHSAQVTSENDKRYYCCGMGGCQNYNANYQMIQVIWPDDQDAIEELLLVRPMTFRNWRPGETLDQLEAENHLKSDISTGPVV